MTIQEAQQQLRSQLHQIYDERETASITNLVMENITGWAKIDRVINKSVLLPSQKIELLKKYSEELLSHKPVQYVLHEAWFAGMKFYVDENVLIPRPETEELVEWIVSSFQFPVQSLELRVESRMDDARRKMDENVFTILDIGSGSGCIPIVLKKKMPQAEIYSCDISEAALNVAKRNAIDNNASINFLHLDFLDQEKRNSLGSFDIIVSNPPYIPLKDKGTMQENVLSYEPHLALFVEDNNTLLFYEAIADFAKEKLSAKGKIFVEIHEEQALNVKELFSFKGFNHVEIKKDMQGKERMIKATMLL